VSLSAPDYEIQQVYPRGVLFAKFAEPTSKFPGLTDDPSTVVRTVMVPFVHVSVTVLSARAKTGPAPTTSASDNAASTARTRRFI